MGRVSKFTRLPREIREEAERLILYHEKSNCEIAAWLQECGFNVSRDAVDRHAKKIRGLFGDLAQFPSLLTRRDAILLIILAELRALREFQTKRAE
jgi:hypothetical protein